MYLHIRDLELRVIFISFINDSVVVVNMSLCNTFFPCISRYLRMIFHVI